jgi:hypothetical protein
VVPSFEEFGLERLRQRSEHLTPCSPVVGGQVAKCLLPTKVIGVDSVNAFLSGFLLGQDLTGEQGEAFTLASEDVISVWCGSR